MITKLGIIIQAIVIALVIGAVVVMVPMLGAIFAVAVTIFLFYVLITDHKNTEELLKEEQQPPEQEGPSKSEQKPQKG